MYCRHRVTHRLKPLPEIRTILVELIAFGTIYYGSDLQLRVSYKAHYIGMSCCFTVLSMAPTCN